MSIKLNTETKEIVISLAYAGRTKIQKMRILEMAKNLDLNSLTKYLESFEGKRQSRMDLNRPTKTVRDRILNKRPNTFGVMFQELFNPNADHAPKSKTYTKWVGVEIECLVDKNKISRLAGITADGDRESETIDCGNCDGSGVVDHSCDDDECSSGETEDCSVCDGTGQVPNGEPHNRNRNLNVYSILAVLFRANKIKYANIKSDGSLRSDDRNLQPVEITILTKQDDYSNLKLACELLTQVGAKVNSSCGLHVHLDMRNKTADDVKEIGKKFKRAMPVLGKLVPESRRSNTYCHLSVSGLSGERYHAVNLTAFSRFKTIEVRLHSGTTDFNKITNWIELCNAIAVSTETIKNVSSINDLETFLNLRESTLEYFTQREELFNPQFSRAVPTSRQLNLHNQSINPSAHDADQIGA